MHCISKEEKKIIPFSLKFKLIQIDKKKGNNLAISKVCFPVQMLSCFPRLIKSLKNLGKGILLSHSLVIIAPLCSN